MNARVRPAVAFGAALLAYGVLLAVSIAILRAGTALQDPVRAAVALLPLPAAVALVVISIRVFLAGDELEQRTRLIGLAVSVLGTLLVTFSWGLLEGLGFERLSGFVVFGVLVTLYVAGLAWATHRYR